MPHRWPHRLPRPVPRRIGLLGGSFNPAHEGHLHISTQLLKRLGLDEIWWLVSPQNPLKSSRGMATLSERVAQAVKMAAPNRRIRVLALETRIGTRFSADTLAKMARLYPSARFVWCMGADNLRQFHHWKQWERIYKLSAIAVIDRPGYRAGGRAASRLAKYRLPAHQQTLLARVKPPVWSRVITRTHPASATDIRECGLWIC